MTVAEMALAYKAGHGEAALFHARLVAFLTKPFLAARHDDEGSASSHMQLLLDLCHSERWQAAARMCSEVLLHTRNQVRQYMRSKMSMLRVRRFDIMHARQHLAVCGGIMHCHCKQAPEAAAMLLIECGVSVVRATHDTKPKSNTIEAGVSILHTYALEGPDCAHEAMLMCREVSSSRSSATWPLHWRDVLAMRRIQLTLSALKTQQPQELLIQK